MSIPNHSILPIEEADLPTIADFLCSSKIQLAVNRFLIKDWPNEPAQRMLYTGAVEGGFKSPETESLKVVHDDSGDIIGHLFLTKCKGSPVEQPPTNDTDESSKLPDFLIPEVHSEVMKTVEEMNEEIQSIDHMDITHIFVEPSSRRQGIGAHLMRLALERAKAAALPLAVCSEPQAHEFFQKQGIKDDKQRDIDLTKWAPPYSGFGVFRIFGMISSK